MSLLQRLLWVINHVFERRPPPFLHTVLATMRSSGFWYARPRTSAGEGAACRLSRWPRRNAPTRFRADPCLWDRCRCIGFYPRPFLKSVFFLCYGPDGHADRLRALDGLLWPHVRRFEQRPVPLGHLPVPVFPCRLWASGCPSRPWVRVPVVITEATSATSAKTSGYVSTAGASHDVGEFQS